MKKLLLLILFVLPVITQAQEDLILDELTTRYKNYNDSSGCYVIKYVFDASFCTVPLTNPPGEPHYFAVITVYEVIKGDSIQIGNEFEGTYVEKGCFEDIPEDQIDTAKKSNKLTVTNTSWQDTFKIDSMIFEGQEVMIYTGNDTLIAYDPKIKLQPSEIPITLQDVFDYEQECKNIYNPKKPTFEGFIAYLRKWYNNYTK